MKTAQVFNSRYAGCSFQAKVINVMQDVVQISIMHINALKTQSIHKNVQTNPEKSQKFTQHSCCSMLRREKT